MEWLYNHGIGTIVISSGEFNNEGRTEFIETILENTMKKSSEIDRGFRVSLPPSLHSRKRRVTSPAAPRFRSVSRWARFPAIQVVASSRRALARCTCAWRRLTVSSTRTFSSASEATTRPCGVDFSPFLHSRNLQKMMKMGYEVYSGTMIGLPFQTDENLIEDVLMMKELKVDGLECDSRWPPT